MDDHRDDHAFMTTEALAGRFVIDVGTDEATGDEVASVVRDDGRHLNLEFIDVLMELAEVRPSAFKVLSELADEFTNQWYMAEA